MKKLRMCRFVATIIIIFSFSNIAEAKLANKLPSAVIVGTVYCDTCFQAELSKPSHFIAGALVGVGCNGTRSIPSFQKQVKTNMKGKFRVHLPFSVSKHVNQIKGCSVKLIRSSEPYCAIASSATQFSLHLKAKTKQTHIFSAGYFTFKPQNQPNLCNQKPAINFNSRKFLPQSPNQPTTVDQNPTIPNLPPTGQYFLPPLPTLPRLPPLPPLPPLPALPGLLPGLLPGVPFFPPSSKTLEKTELPDFETKKDQIFPQNPQPLTFPSSPPAFGFQFPPFSFRQPPINFPPNPFPPSVNIPTIPNFNPSPVIQPPPFQSLPSVNTPTTPNFNPPIVQAPPSNTNPLPPFPFEPSLPNSSPATVSEKNTP